MPKKSLFRRRKPDPQHQLYEALSTTLPAMVWVCDPSKAALWYSPKWLEFTGRSMEEEINKDWTETIHPDDIEACIEAYFTHFDQRLPFVVQYRSRHHSGEYRWIECHCVPRFDAQKSFLGYIGVCTDISERQTATEQLAEIRHEAEVAKQAKSDVMAHLSHELRTPMNAIIGLSNILGMSQPLTPQQKEWVDTLKLSADNLLALINENFSGSTPSPKPIVMPPAKPRVTPTPAHRGSKESILLVEDYPANILVARTLLEQMDYTCDVATSGQEAVEKFTQNEYALVLMDVQMHGMNGFEATAAIRALEATRGSAPVPIIGLTANALVGDKKRCIEAGMTDYMPKPIDPEILEEKLTQLIARSTQDA